MKWFTWLYYYKPTTKWEWVMEILQWTALLALFILGQIGLMP
jgi:hypothetical protein